MRLLGKIGSAADDVILPVFDLGDEGGPFGIDIDINPVSDCNRIGGTDFFQAEIPLDLTFYIATIIGAYSIQATRILNNQSPHVN